LRSRGAVLAILRPTLLAQSAYIAACSNLLTAAQDDAAFWHCAGKFLNHRACFAACREVAVAANGLFHSQLTRQPCD
jgi:hypothetical protein